MKYRYCLFDLDGTLTDPGLGITNSVMYALGKFGISVSERNSLFCFIGPPLAESFRKYFAFSVIEAGQAVVYYREYFKDRGIYENAVYEGIPALLETLAQSGITVALATSKPYEFAVRILRHFDLYRYFGRIGAATMDGSVSRKEDVIARLLDRFQDMDKSSVLMVGDRAQDIYGARANGLNSAGVLWGYGSRAELEEAGADHLVKAPQDLLKLCL